VHQPAFSIFTTPPSILVRLCSQASFPRNDREANLHEDPPGVCVVKIEKLVGALRSIESDKPEVTEKIRTEADYFERNAERMLIPQSLRRQHLFVGSGVI